nr:putative phytosulfokines 6 [Tanacetum cinerariifolium]
MIIIENGEEMVQHDESKNTNEGSPVDIETINSFDEMMGLEACLSGDEECLKRRVLAEAHLDYIYTQKHKP